MIKAQDFKAAKQAFTEYLEHFPDGSYTANGYYWLGELHLLDQEYDSAQQSFSALLERFPDNRKVPDAMFKLAKVYHLQGNADEAKALLQKVVSQYAISGNSAAQLAQDYLNKHFR